MLNGWAITPRASGYNFWGCWGVHGPQNTPILWQCIIARSALRAINTLNPPKKYIRKLRGLLPIHLTRRCGAQGLMWGTRGPFLPAAAMVVTVVMPVVFCAKATEKQNKNTKISCFLPKSLFNNIYCKTYCNSYTANCAWPSPSCGVARARTTFVQWTPAYWVSPENSYDCENNSHIVLRPKCRNIREREKRLSTSYLELLIILDFWLF